MPSDEGDDEFNPRQRDRGPADLRLVQQAVQSNAQRLIELEGRYLDLKDVQDRLVAFARHRQRQWRLQRYYVNVLFHEMQP